MYNIYTLYIYIYIRIKNMAAPILYFTGGKDYFRMFIIIIIIIFIIKVINIIINIDIETSIPTEDCISFVDLCASI